MTALLCVGVLYNKVVRSMPKQMVPQYLELLQLPVQGLSADATCDKPKL